MNHNSDHVKENAIIGPNIKGNLILFSMAKRAISFLKDVFFIMFFIHVFKSLRKMQISATPWKSSKSLFSWVQKIACNKTYTKRTVSRLVPLEQAVYALQDYE